jgi:hypothetical protein
MELVAGNIYIRPNKLAKAGMLIDGHKHNFDHVSIVFTGAVRVVQRWPNGFRVQKNFRAPDHFLVRADCEHEITSLQDNTEFWCVYSHRTPQGDVVQEATGWEEAYR